MALTPSEVVRVKQLVIDELLRQHRQDLGPVVRTLLDWLLLPRPQQLDNVRTLLASRRTAVVTEHAATDAAAAAQKVQLETTRDELTALDNNIATL
jgi:hypothetical protein